MNDVDKKIENQINRINNRRKKEKMSVRKKLVIVALIILAIIVLQFVVTTGREVIIIRNLSKVGKETASQTYDSFYKKIVTYAQETNVETTKVSDTLNIWETYYKDGKELNKYTHITEEYKEVDLEYIILDEETNKATYHYYQTIEYFDEDEEDVKEYTEDVYDYHEDFSDVNVYTFEYDKNIFSLVWDCIFNIEIEENGLGEYVISGSDHSSNFGDEDYKVSFNKNTGAITSVDGSMRYTYGTVVDDSVFEEPDSSEYKLVESE